MGRKKIPIERIPDNRNRQITFMKRKLGLFKKAYQLSVLCDCQISVIIMPKNNKLFQYSSSDMNAILQKYVSHPHPDEALTNEDMAKKIQSVALGSDDDVETPVQDMTYDGVRTMFNQQVILDQQYKPQIDPRMLHPNLYQRALVDPSKLHAQDIRMQYQNPILPHKMPVAVPSHLEDASPRSVQSATDLSSISSPPPKEDIHNKSERLKVIESGNLSLTLPMSSKIPANPKATRAPVATKPLKIVVPNSKGIPVSTTIAKTGEKGVGQGMIMASSHLHTPNINMQTPREMVFTSDGMDFFSSATYTPFGLGINNFPAATEDRDGANTLGNLIPLSHAATLSRADLQKQIKSDPDPIPIGAATPSEQGYQSADEDESPLTNHNQEAEGSTNSELVQIPAINLNGLSHNESSTHPITHSLLGRVNLSEALDEGDPRDTGVSPVSRVPLQLSGLSQGQNSDTMMSLNTSETTSSANPTPVRTRRKAPATGINESTRTALQSKLNGHIPSNGSAHSLLPSNQIQSGNPTLSFMNAPHLQMNYYQHIPQITPGLGAAFYSPSEYLTKPSEFPINAIRLINPSLIHSQAPVSHAADRDPHDVANMPSPPSSGEGYADTDASNKRQLEQAALEDLAAESLPRKKAHTASSDQML